MFSCVFVSVAWLKEQEATGNHCFYTPRNREFTQKCSLKPIPDSRIISGRSNSIPEKSLKIPMFSNGKSH